MKLKSINYSQGFFKSLKKLPKEQLRNLLIKEKIFKEDLFDARLKTHKLKDELSDFYTFSLSYHWRIVFHFANKSTVVLDSIGTHAVYQ